MKTKNLPQIPDWAHRSPSRNTSGRVVNRRPPKFRIYLRAWIFCAGLLAWILSAVMVFLRRPAWAALCAAFGLAADTAGRVWSRKSPLPMPHFMRFMLFLPRGPHSPKDLKRVLQPRTGERVLEIGPGVGVHAIPIASALLPSGVLDVLDVQQEMLDDLVRRARRSGLRNIEPTIGDAQTLPYADHTFDAAYMIGVLGEILDAVTTLHELKRVVKPGGRIVISELLIDPDFISVAALRVKASEAGLLYERTAGPSFAYSAVLRTPSA